MYVMCYIFVDPTQKQTKPPPGDTDRKILALPIRLSGLGVVNPTKLSTSKLLASINTSAPLRDLILNQSHEYSMDCPKHKSTPRKDTHKRNHDNAKTSATTLRTISNSLQRAMDLAQEKGASSLPLEEFCFILHKSAFRDAIALLYGWQP